jgi:membrane protease YdiL (CAAX protease family)
LALTSGVFGVLHAYQGWIGTVRAAALGGLLAWGFLLSGSLVPAIVAHTAIDLLAGIVLSDVLLPPAESNGVEGSRSTHPDEDR